MRADFTWNECERRGLTPRHIIYSQKEKKNQTFRCVTMNDQVKFNWADYLDRFLSSVTLLYFVSFDQKSQMGFVVVVPAVFGCHCCLFGHIFCKLGCWNDWINTLKTTLDFDFSWKSLEWHLYVLPFASFNSHYVTDTSRWCFCSRPSLTAAALAPPPRWLQQSSKCVFPTTGLEYCKELCSITAFP